MIYYKVHSDFLKVKDKMNIITIRELHKNIKEYDGKELEICGWVRSVRASKKAPGAERIYTAGEKEYEIRLARKDGVPINESVQKEIIAVRDELGLTQYKFPWED